MNPNKNNKEKKEGLVQKPKRASHTKGEGKK